MAKLGKEKFTDLGKHIKDRTTSSYNIELYLYYDTDKDYFYFDKKEYEKFTRKEIPYGTFQTCKTKASAIAIMKSYLCEVTAERKKWIAIYISTQDLERHGSKVLNFNKSYGADGEKSCSVGLGISYYFSFMLDDVELFTQTDKNFTKTNGFTTNKPYMNLIPYTEERELFMLKAIESLKEVSKKVEQFFSVSDIVQLDNKITQSDRLIS